MNIKKAYTDLDAGLKKISGRLFGGMDMSWENTIGYALLTAIITAFFLIIPAFERTSFERMGQTFEAWVFFAVIIMSNCKKPLESAVKTFVFFLIGQPLIYLLQVPVSWLGWQIFTYYPRWFILTLLTFPAAYIGWYIRKRNWLSLLILSPMLFLLAEYCLEAFRYAFTHFPRMLLTALFCLAQAVLYMYAFTGNKWQKLLGLLIPFIVMGVMVFSSPMMELTTKVFLPDEPVLTEAAEVVCDDTDFAEISVYETGESSKLYIHAWKYGTVDFTIIDSENEYPYTLEVYEDREGHSQTRITQR